MYTGRLDLTCQNIVDVFQAAKHLDMKNIKEKCAEVLTSSPDDPLHALFVYVSGKRLGTKPAWQRAYKTILSRFQDVVALPEFLNLDMDHVSEILSGDAIAARSETELYWAALKWLSFDWSAREKHVVDLLKCIRFSCMTMNEAVACFHPPILSRVTEMPEVREMLNNAVCYISAKQVGQEGKFKQYTHPRRRFSLKGDSGSPPDQGMGDTSTVASNSPPSPMLRDRCAPLKCRSAPTGRRRTTMATARSAAPQPSTSGETSPPAMLEQERTSQVDATQSGSEREIQLHVQEIPTSAAESKAWTADPMLHRLLQSRSLGKHTRIEWDEYPAKALPEDSRLRHGSPGFLLVGGIDPEFPQQVSTGCTVLAYEEADDRWHRIAMLPEPRHHHAGAIAGDSVYVVGGLNSRRTVAGRVSPLASCLCYQLGQRQWDTLPDLHQSRAFHGCANVSGSIFAVGGKDKRGRLLDSVECLEPNASRWKVLGESLRPARMAMGVAAAGRLLCLAGGIAQLGGRLCVLADVDCYDVAAKRWLRGPRLPWPVCFGSLISAPGGSLIHVGGLSVSGVVHGPELQEKTTSFRSRSDVVLWEPTSSGTCWRPLCPLPEPRHGVGAALCGKNGTLYVLGGLSSSTDRPPLGVLSAATSGDGTFYRASQLPGPVTGSLALPLPDTETTSSERRRSLS
ncbi:uncharacterized protein LOC120846339 [Ixodes scapularis]|uniref:uncharacterized protein LOC120846339 n=1 Tax=Ixodes scapularis TaxID=6945 RepID=UPI001AD66F71|nr:uncharacterized protein LOC120846339 [Ixodes scapularis]